jgi:hypothetical protein
MLITIGRFWSSIYTGEHMNSDEHLALSGALTTLSLLLHLLICQAWLLHFQGINLGRNRLHSASDGSALGLRLCSPLHVRRMQLSWRQTG